MVDIASRLLRLFELRLFSKSRVNSMQERIAALEGTKAALEGANAEQQRIARDRDRVNLVNQVLTRQLQDVVSDRDRVNLARIDSRRQAMRFQTQLNRQRSLTSTASESRTVVVVTAISQIPQLKAFADALNLAKGRGLVVVAYFDALGSGLVEFCVESGIALLNHNCELMTVDVELEHLLIAEEPTRPFFGSNISLEAYDAEDRRLLEHANELLAEIHLQNGIALQANRILRRLEPSALVLFEDNAAYHTGIWISTARRNDIPSVVFPYAIIDQSDAAEAYFNDPVYWAEEGVFNSFVKRALPKWTLSYRDRALLRRRATGAMTSEVLGFAQPDPWVWNSTTADVLAVESEAMRAVYLAQGVLDAQIEVTGGISDDLLCNALANRDSIRRELGLDAQRPTLVCAFPPNQLGINRSEPEFSDFETVVDRWLGELAKLEGWQIVVKPHPAMQADDIALLRRFGFPVTTLDTTSLIAVCDLFNTSVSSTIRWALACGRPTLNYDVYRYRYRDFVNEQAVVTVYDFEEFSGQLRRLTGDSAALREVTETAKAGAPQWGILDGKSAARMVAVLDRLSPGKS